MLGKFGRKPRVFIDEYGQKYTVYLQRFRCAGCGELFLERPDCFEKHKQYLKELVDTVHAGIRIPAHLKPSRATYYRWIKESK